jgi:hypothetical protein
MSRHSDYLDPARRVRDIANCRRNVDDGSLEWAARNLMEDVPAYWSMKGRDASGVSSRVASLANFHGSLTQAMTELDATFAARPHIKIAVDVYDALIPLNMAAVEELDRLYRLASTFRDRDDLLSREEAAICDPYWSDFDGNETRELWSDDYAAAQARFHQRREHFNPIQNAAE